MKQLYKEQKHTTYEISKQVGKRPDYLYRYIRKEANIDKMSLKLAIDIAQYENISVEELYEKIKEELWEEKS